MRMTKGLIVALSIAALGFTAPAFAAREKDADSTPICHGKARVAGEIAREDGSMVAVPLTLDLRGVAGPDGQPANLAGYLAVVTFDPAQVSFEGAKGGDNANFTQSPVFTNKSLANEKGQVKVTSAHTNESGSAGEVNVARLRFRELTPGGASTIKVTFEQAATPMSSLTKQIARIQLDN